MIVTGIDLVDIARLEEAIGRHGARFLDRVFTPAEQATCDGNVQRLAGRWAIKEAVAKAFGTGIGDMKFVEIEVSNDERGKPVLLLHGDAQRMSNEQDLTAWTISLSHTETHATGIAIGYRD